jgi:hypothetical protein
MSDRNHELVTRIAGVAWIGAVAFACLLIAAAAGAEKTPAGVEKALATLPLEEILELYRERDAAERDRGPAPPMAAALQKLELTGRLLADGIDFDAHFEVMVLGDEQWVSVPLLAYDAGSHVSSLPTVTRGAFAVSEGQLVFLTQKRGRYSFDLSFHRAAAKQDRERRVALTHGGAALATCRLEIDAGLFDLRTEEVIEARDGVLVLPRGDSFEIAWEVREEAERDTAEPGVAPEIESVIPRVHASTVSTLEGRRITRVLYELRFAGRKPLAIDLPAGHTLERAFLNGIATVLDAEDGRIEIEVAPARAGEAGGTLELVLARSRGVFHLAGGMHFDLPAVSWPTHELFLSVHLPRVFDYAWAGGSLEPGTRAPTAEYSYRVPLPGKTLHFHQVLIDRSAPDLDLDYEVDLEGHYFQEGRQVHTGVQAVQQCVGQTPDGSC